MPTDIPIAQAIQLAIGPVFLLVAMGGLLNVLTSRLARIVDRIRDLEDHYDDDGNSRRDLHAVELAGLDRRIVRINASITLATLAALLVCLVVVALFAMELSGIDLSDAIAGLFIATMIVVVLSLAFFLSEIYVASRMLRVSVPFRRRKAAKSRTTS